MKYLLVLFLAFFGANLLVTDNDPSYNSGGPVSDAQSSIDVLHYDINLLVNPEKKSIMGTTIITWKQTVNSEIAEFDLDTVYTVHTVEFCKKKNKCKEATFTHKNGKIFIESKKGFIAGKTYTYQIQYSGKPREAEKAPWLGGFSWDKDANGDPWIGVSCQINGADLWFPCKDQQNDRAESVSLLINVPKGLQAVSNGTLYDLIENKKFTTYVWHTNYPINNYAISFNVGNFKKHSKTFNSINGNSFPISFYQISGSNQDAIDLLDQYEDMLKFLESKLGAYPFSKEKSAFINAPYIGMEHQTILSISKDVKKNGGGYNYILFHELAHEWFGNQSTAKNWGNLFLQEGLATYFEILYHEYKSGKNAYKNRVKHNMSLAKNKHPMVLQGEEFSQDFYFRDTDYFQKGVAFLHVLRSEMGDEAFFNGIKNYIGNTSQSQFTTINDFQAAMEKAYGSNLIKYFDTYCHQAELPQLKIVVKKGQVVFSWKNKEELPLEIEHKGEIHRLKMLGGLDSMAIAYKDKFQIDPNFKLYKEGREFIHRPYDNREEMLDHMIGQMIIVGVRGTKPSQDKALLDNIRKGRVGGVVLYEKNIDKKNPKEGFKTLIDSLHAASTMLPFLVSIDQEGGAVNRLKTKYGYPKSVTATYLGNLNDFDTTRHYASITAKECDYLGINVNFAPVLDLCKNKENPIIAKYERCYSDEPELTAKHAMETVRGHHDYNVLTVVKHFPGHGSSRHDTHEGMADVTDYWGEEELIPFRRLIDANLCDAVMTAHIVNRKLCADGYPATFSTEVNQKLLREEMGFDGVIFSDDMQMKAVSKHYGTKEAIRLTINSGVDFLMFSNNIGGVSEQTIDNVHRLIKELVEEGAISYERIEESYLRIIEFKNQFSEEAI